MTCLLGVEQGVQLYKVVDVPVVVRQGSGPDVQKTVELPQLQFLDKVNMPVVVQRQAGLWTSL